MMKKMIKYLLACTALVYAGTSAGQQTAAVAHRFFADPALEVHTPWFEKGRAFTTYEEMMDYLNKQVAAHPETATLSFIGKTQKGKDIPAVLIKAPGSDPHIRVLFTGRVHGDEPGSTEGLLYVMDRLLNDPSLSYLKDRIEVAIVPMVNIDGGCRLERATANGLDMNRDQSKLQTPEALALRKYYETFNPQVMIDFHEFQPLRADYTAISTDNITNPFDAMFLYSGNLNIPAELREMTSRKFVENARTALDKEGLRHHDYFTTDKRFGEVVFSIGGINPRSTANAFGLSNSVAILMELRGVKIGKTSLKRRVHTVSELAESYLKTAYDNAAELERITSEAARSAQDIVVTSRAKQEEHYKLPFISMNKNEMVELDVPATLSLQSEATLTRKRPEAYYITASHPEIAAKLEQFGIKVGRLEKPETIRVEAYEVTSHRQEYAEFEKFHPVKVKTDITAKEVTFPAGTFVVTTAQKNGTLASVLLEPETPNGFVNYRLYETGEGQELPVYRKVN